MNPSSNNPFGVLNRFATPQEERLARPRRVSDLALNCALFAVHLVTPTDTQRGAIAVPLNIREGIRERRGGGRRGSYDVLRSPPPGEVVGQGNVKKENVEVSVKEDVGEDEEEC